MENLEAFTIPKLEVTERLNDLYQKSDVNILQLTKKFEAMTAEDFDPMHIPIQDIAAIQKAFPALKDLTPSNRIIFEETDKIPNNTYTEEDTAFLRTWDSKNYIKFAWNKVKAKKTF